MVRQCVKKLPADARLDLTTIRSLGRPNITTEGRGAVCYSEEDGRRQLGMEGSFHEQTPLLLCT